MIGLILALAVYLLVWHSHCTRARFNSLQVCCFVHSSKCIVSSLVVTA